MSRGWTTDVQGWTAQMDRGLYPRSAQLGQDYVHSLRHTYASWFVIVGVDLYRVKELMGHASIQTTMRYAHLTLDTLKNEVERVFG